MNQVMQIEQSCSTTSPALAEDNASSPAGPMVFTVGQGSAPVLKLVSPVEGGAPQLIKVVPAVVSTTDEAQQEGKVAGGTLMVHKVEDGQQSEVVSQRVYSIVQKSSTQSISTASVSTTVAKNTFNNGQQRVHTLSALPTTARVIPASSAAAATQKVQILSNVVVSKQNIVLNKNSLQAQRQILTTPLAQKQLNINTAKPQPQPINSVVLTTQQKPAPSPNSVKTIKPVGGSLNRPLAAQPQKTIKTLSPQPQSGYAPKTIKTLSPQMNHYNKQMQQNQRVGIKTLAPQRGPNNNNRAQKPNYIGKHASQAQKSHKPNLQTNLTMKSRTPSAQSPVKYNNQKSAVGNTQSNFNQSLTAQILQSLPSTGTRPVAEYPLQSPPDDASLSEDIGEEVKPDFSPNLSYLYQVVMLDHNYGAPPPALSVAHTSPEALNGAPAKRVDDDAASTISSDGGNLDDGEETETAPEGEGDEDGVTRCICDFDHDDGYMICCDVCSSWQHVDCMGLDRDHIPDKYSCVRCLPRRVDRQHARAIQQRKREEFARLAITSTTTSTPAAPAQGSASDSSSDASSDSDRERTLHSVSLNNNVQNKKRSAPVSVARRKSEPVRRALPLKRQRRESAAAPSRRVKKREKKQIMKRKMKSRSSVDDSSQDSWPSSYTNLGTSLLQLRQWIENYEEAVTNHYSPELRARITNMRVNGHQTDKFSEKEAPSSAAQDVQLQKCRVGNQPLTGLKIVLAGQALAANTPVIELRGKYMLSTQHRASGGAASGGLLTRQHAQRPGPFLFFYRLPRDGTEVCVDTRTYGNDARFIRRSCRPNAELRHLVEKGTLHLYIITTSSVDKNTELTLRHESHDLAAVAAGPTVVPCACNAPSTCLLYTHRTNGVEQHQPPTEEPETTRKRRGRRASSPRRVTPPQSPPHSPTREKTPVREVEKEKESLQMVTRRASGSRVEPKEKEPKEKVEPRERDKDEPPTTTKDIKDKKKKLTREERKMEAIMKAFERLEKAEQRKQEVQARQARKEVDPPSTPILGPTTKENGDSEREKIRRKKRKGRARTVSTTSQSSTRRRTRLNSTDSYITSGDESSLLSPPLPPAGAAMSPTKPPPFVEDAQEESPKLSQTSGMSSPGQVNTAAGLLLALANGGGTSTTPPPSMTTPATTPTTISVQKEESDKCAENDSSGSNSLTSSPGTPLSSACLLVAAAVGPLEPGFKFPKTKKAIMNEWLNKSPDQPIEELPQPSQPFEFYSSTKNLATLVQAATLCDTPQTFGGKSLNSGNAKKRWLRQAISEECDSPCRPEEDVTNQEPVAPPKKRRLARESLSSEQSFTPPTTPTMLVPPNHSLDDETFPNNDEEFYETQISDSSPPIDKAPVCGAPVAAGPVFRDSAQLLGTVEKTIRFYEESLTGTVPPLTEPQPPEPLEPPEEVEEPPSPVPPSPVPPSPVPLSKPEVITPAKRKLSISEYRQRKQLKPPDRSVSPPLDRSVSPETPPLAPSPALTSSATCKPCPRSRSASTSSSSSTTSSLSDEELPTVACVDAVGADAPKGEKQVAVAFNSAPTAVERQRENVERLKKAFGLSLDDDSKRNLIRDMIKSPQQSAEKTLIKPAKTATVMETKPEEKVDPFEETTSFIPPFNNPVYPNSTQFTSFSSVIDSSPYEGRNPSPPPSELIKSNNLHK